MGPRSRVKAIFESLNLIVEKEHIEQLNSQQYDIA